MTALQIREAESSDRASIEEVTLAAYAQFGQSMLPDHWAYYRQSILATLASVGSAVQFVASHNEKVVGSVLLYPSGATVAIPGTEAVVLSVPEVRLLAVTPSARGLGVGEALMRACITRARESGASCLELHTTNLMEAAMKLYAHMGFDRAPELDSQPVPEISIKGFRLNLRNT